MTRDEFDQFFVDHTKRFVGFHAWMAKKVPKDPDGTYSETFAIWAKVMRNADYDDAVAASQQMYEADDAPRWYEKHWPALASRARKIHISRNTKQSARPRMVDGQEAYRCLQCRDYGFARVWSEVSRKFADRKCENAVTPIGETGKTLGDPGTCYECVAACACGAGEPWRRGGVPEYNPNVHCLIGQNADGTVSYAAQMSDVDDDGVAYRQEQLVAFVNKSMVAGDFTWQPEPGGYEASKGEER